MDGARSMSAQQTLRSPQIRSGFPTVHAQKPRAITKRNPHTLKVRKRRRYHCSFVPQQRVSHNSAGCHRVRGRNRALLPCFQAFCPHPRVCEIKQQKYRSLLSTVTRVDAWRFEHTEHRGRYPLSRCTGRKGGRSRSKRSLKLPFTDAP